MLPIAGMSGMATTAMGTGGGGQTEETNVSPTASVNLGGFSGGNFSVNGSIFDGLSSKNKTTQLITGAVLLGGVLIAGTFAVKLLGGK